MFFESSISGEDVLHTAEQTFPPAGVLTALCFSFFFFLFARPEQQKKAIKFPMSHMKRAKPRIISR